MEMEKKKIAVICTSNSCRSQMAEGFLRHFGEDTLEVYSAGTVKSEVNPYATAVMKEVGIDLTTHESNSLDELPQVHWDLVFTVCDEARESCPYIPAKKHLHHGFNDPTSLGGTDDEIMQGFRKTREEVQEYCRDLVKDITGS
jgi:arsenate reductase